MKLGIAGPIDMTMLRDLFSPEAEIPSTYSFPLTADLARTLRTMGHEVTVFATSLELTSTRRIDGDGITAYICPQRRVRYRLLDFSRGERHALRDAMRTSGCEVIHAHWAYEFGAAAVESGLPHVVTAHDVPKQIMRFARNLQGLYGLTYPLLAWPVLRYAKSVTAVSPYVADALRCFLKPHRKIAIVPNGVGQALFDAFERRQPHSEATPFTFASVLNGFPGRKNGSTLIEAFSILREEFGERVRLLMFGVGYECGGEAHRWAFDRLLTAGVEFIGKLPQSTVMDRLAQDVDVVVHPALEESFCMVAAEAMALGLPVIGGLHSGGITWVLGHGQAGLLVDVTSPIAIAEGMRTLLQDPELRNALARSGHAKAYNEFRLIDIARKYESVISKALEEQTR